MRPPKNQILENLYTNGNEYLLVKTYDNYVGYYHSVSGKKYIGATYKTNAIELVPYTQKREVAAYNLSNIDPVYMRINPNVINTIKKDEFPIVRVNYTPTTKESYRFFIKRINEVNASILEVDKQTYTSAKATRFYYTLNILWNSDDSVLNYTLFENQMPGIDNFLRNSSQPPGGDAGGF
jgi:hypothetical protein